LFIGLFAFAIAMVFGHVVWNEINDGLQGTDIVSDQPEVVEVLDSGTKLVNGFDFLFIFILVALFITLLISFFFIESHPIFFAVALIL